MNPIWFCICLTNLSWFYGSNNCKEDFPGNLVVKNLPASADSVSGPGRFHMPKQHNTEAHVPRACALQLENPPQWEACASQPESSPHSPQLEKACTQQ